MQPLTKSGLQPASSMRMKVSPPILMVRPLAGLKM